MTKRIRVHLQQLTRRGQTSYRLRYTTPEGRQTETLGQVTLQEAEDARTLLEARLAQGGSSSSSRLPAEPPAVRRVLGLYGDDLLSRCGEDSAYVANVVNRTAPLIRHLGAVYVDRIDDRLLTDYAHARAKEPGGRRGNALPKKSVILDELKLLRRAIRWFSRSWAGHIPVPGVPKLKGLREDARPKRRVSLEELDQVLGALRGRGGEAAARLVEFMAWCPRRPVAIFGLTRADCARVLLSAEAHPDGDLWISDDKGGHGLGWCPLLPRAREVLREHLRATIGPPDGVVWTRSDGQPWTNQAARGLLLRAAHRAGVTFLQPYDLRRFGVTRALRACGGDPEAAMAFTGHTTSATVLRYAYADRDVVRAAARGERT